MKQLFPRYFLLSFILLLLVMTVQAQQKDSTGRQKDTVPAVAPSAIPSLSYSAPKQYEIAGIAITGAHYLDESILISTSGLSVGDKIVLPGDQLSKAITNLWRQGLFADIKIYINKIIDNKIYLDLHVTERPRLSKYIFKGIRSGETDDLKKKTGLDLMVRRVVTENTKLSATEAIRKFYEEKGFRNVQIRIDERPDPSFPNSVILVFNVDKGKKVRINQINLVGNENVSDKKLKKLMKGTKEMTRITLHPAQEQSAYGAEKRSFKKYLRHRGYLSISQTLDALEPYFRFKLFSSAKFSEKKYKEDKQKLIAYYNSKGYRDAQIEADTTYFAANGNLNVDLKIKEGKKYYFGDIAWKGNTKYPDSILNRVLGIKKGDIYNLELLEKKLGIQLSQEGGDISGLYQDDGYLFFHVTPVEVAIHGDSIDYELRMTEGPQATIKNVTIAGNDKTNEHVIRRELRTIPGEKFSRTDLIRSQREISALGFFNPEKVSPNIQPNPEDGTVDIGWNVEEKPSDQLELSAGWGGYIGLTGTLGVTFNNFSLRNILHKESWTPLPSGDGQKLSVRVQSNGKYYRSYNFSFTEPWLGGKKKNPFSINFYNSYFSGAGYSVLYGGSPDASYLRTIGASVSYGKQLRWPDDYFSLSYAINYQQFKLKEYTLFANTDFRNGLSNNLSLRVTLARTSVDQLIFPRSGSNFTLYGQFTPPYSLLNNKDYSKLNAAERFKFIEYMKFRLNAEWYVPLGKPKGTDNKTFVLKAAAKFGFLSQYNSNVELSPFERFEVGGDGISNYANFYGKDIISNRGYEVYYSSNPKSTATPFNYQGFTIFNKFVVELRYPFSLNPSSTIFGLAFVEAANGYSDFKEYNPFRLRRSAGLGMRFYLPMFGLLGFDYGIGFDRLRPGIGLKDAAKFTFMLGFEPE